MQSFVKTDKYWGEFSEEEMDKVLLLCKNNDFGAARKYINNNLRRTDFIFGSARSDFLYMSNVDKSSVCLDIGCGLGIHTFNLAKIAKEVHSCDLSKKRLEFCEARQKSENVNNVTFYHSDIANLPFQKESFDFIVMNGVVEWLGEQNINKDPRMDQVEDLKRVYSLLKKGGVLYVGIENRYAATYLHNAKDHNRLSYTTFMPRFLANIVTKIKVGKAYRTYTYGTYGYKKLLEDSGFKRVDLEFYVAHPGYNLPQYVIDIRDLNAFSFFFKSVISGRWFGKYVLWVFNLKIVPKVLRYFFYSYVIFAKK
jgi:ubiquinone/menaquinone biosynthesis C-methylase UbiE